ncbi:hypothetical protein ANN_23810 [Periplaneta americana]|uniref:Reverse transcriptase domain-containing protein n=1 Tax=Periplaneta americana TaxID=6978 RepID=A0ABQ8SNK2_PERAM|nr:hypothetical protein ANN_23810 [Periplaneta americana]
MLGRTPIHSISYQHHPSNLSPEDRDKECIKRAMYIPLLQQDGCQYASDNENCVMFADTFQASFIPNPIKNQELNDDVEHFPNQDVTLELKSLNLPVIKVTRLFYRDRQPMPLCAVELDNNEQEHLKHTLDSDHCPVLISFDDKSKLRPSTNRLIEGTRNCNYFQLKLDDVLQPTNNLKTITDSNAAVRTFTGAITSSIRAATILSRSHSKLCIEVRERDMTRRAVANNNLASLFNALLVRHNSEYFPDSWKHTVIIVIHKPGKPVSNPTTYRPISLLSTISKVFEKVLLKRLDKFLLQDFSLAFFGIILPIINASSHSNDLPVPKPPDQYSTDEESAIKSDSDETFLSEDEEKGPHLLSQSELDDFIRELELPKCKAELVASRFKEWSRATDQHYTQKIWAQREHLIPGKHNVIHEALVPREKILLLPLHIKLGLVKQFVKALEPNSVAYLHIRKMFPHLSDAKVKGGIFTGPQIRLMLSSQELEQKMTDIERNAWKAFRAVVTGFLGNKKSDNYEEIVASLLEHY